MKLTEIIGLEEKHARLLEKEISKKYRRDSESA